MKQNLLISSLFVIWCTAVHARPFVYVTNDISDTITLVDIRTNSIITTINTLATYPWQCIITPDNKTVYVLNSTTFNASSVTPIDTQTNTASQPITVGNGAYDLALTPDGNTLYVTNTASSNVIPIDTATHTAGTPISVPGTPFGIAITPNGTTAYISLTSTDTNNPGGIVIPLDIATNTLGNAINVGLTPVAVAITPDGSTAYVANMGDSTLSIIDIGSNKVKKTLNINAVPVGIAIRKDELKAYVISSNAGTITVIDIAQNNIESIIMLGSSYPVGITISPDTRTLYVSSLQLNAVIPVDIQTQMVGTPITGITAPRGLIATPPTLPPSNFIGTLSKNIYTGESILTASWQASPTVDVVLYRIYLADRVVDEVLVDFPLTITACLVSQQDAQEYEVAAVSANNLESEHVHITLSI